MCYQQIVWRLLHEVGRRLVVAHEVSLAAAAVTNLKQNTAGPSLSLPSRAALTGNAAIPGSREKIFDVLWEGFHHQPPAAHSATEKSSQPATFEGRRQSWSGSLWNRGDLNCLLGRGSRLQHNLPEDDAATGLYRQQAAAQRLLCLSQQQHSGTLQLLAAAEQVERLPTGLRRR